MSYEGGTELADLADVPKAVEHWIAWLFISWPARKAGGILGLWFLGNVGVPMAGTLGERL